METQFYCNQDDGEYNNNPCPEQCNFCKSVDSLNTESDTTQTKIERLQADKEELLEALEEINSKLNNMHLTDDRLTAIYNTNRSLIQKMKQ